MKIIVLLQKAERDMLASKDYQPRKEIANTDALLSSGLIKLITGPRRAGKSVFALQMLQGKNYAYLNFDDSSLLSGFEENSVMKALSEVYPGYEYLLLDEIQNLDGWDTWVTTSMKETLQYTQVNMQPELPTDQAALSNAMGGYLKNGGYPEIVKIRDIERTYMGSLFDSIILKDVAKRHKIRKTTELYDLADYLITNYSCPLSYTGIAQDLGLGSVTTVKKFCKYLEEPYLFKKGTKVDALIQVVYEISKPKTRKRELDALVIASDELKCNNLMLITWDTDELVNYKDKEIRIVSARNWFLKET